MFEPIQIESKLIALAVDPIHGWVFHYHKNSPSAFSGELVNGYSSKIANVMLLLPFTDRARTTERLFQSKLWELHHNATFKRKELSVQSISFNLNGADK